MLLTFGVRKYTIRSSEAHKRCKREGGERHGHYRDIFELLSILPPRNADHRHRFPDHRSAGYGPWLSHRAAAIVEIQAVRRVCKAVHHRHPGNAASGAAVHRLLSASLHSVAGGFHSGRGAGAGHALYPGPVHELHRLCGGGHPFRYSGGGLRADGGCAVLRHDPDTGDGEHHPAAGGQEHSAGAGQ